MASENQELKWIGTSPVRPDGTDKVTGRAKFGADLMLPGMLTGKILRSPHAHAKIKSIDTSKAEALPGVKAVVSAADIAEMPSEWVPAGELQLNYRDLASNIMARGKALYDGHAVAAVAATSAAIADAALDLIAVDYEVLPHVIDVEEAMAPDAPVLHEDMFTEGVTPTPDKPSNIFKEIDIGIGDVETGFAAADLIVERSFKTAPVHQGYIEPHAAVASFAEDGQAELWCSTQGHFTARAYCAKLLGMDVSDLRVTASEIGGGFGGKTTVYVEPVALLLSRKAGRPVRVVMTRDEVFRASGPTSGAANWVKIGVTNDGKIVAGEAVLKYQAGAFPGSPVQPGCMCAFAPYDIENVKVKGYDVVTNRPKVAAYRAPGAPIAEHAVESVLDEVAKKLGMDPIELRQKNAAREGTNAAYGPKFGPIGYAETLAAAKAHPHYSAPLGPNQGRGVASGFWFNVGGDSCATMNVSEDGTLVLATGSPDIGGSRASMAIMAAETLGIDVADVRPIVADTASLGYTFLTGGSRVTFATGMAVIEASKQIAEELRQRAAKIWDISVDAVVWEDGYAKPAGANAGDFEPLSIGDIAAQAGKTGGPISANAALNAQGAGPGFGTHICDVEVDPETGRVTVLRYTAIQDCGKAIHKAYVEGQIQGGAAQGIGWALNEEYIYDEKGRLDNPGFLDYRIPVASDLPMIEAVIVEVANPTHPYGVRGVGEVPIIPPMATVANAIEGAIGVRMTELPMSPPKVLAALDNGR
ncbi:MAG: xanthine dehydrogenase family protein molybdopterin-binding subunit [Alphaproteobacteria bacterium]|jgi:CO/xanthine dehydrogenase Mo-binding subunit|nr:xanthine dehydrogenase family protein molybdopterin-binding subunit [Alphaproteobacteria bacterium]MDP6590702.1 xanthine dehydrogenase family protein molybdopterin-binding subunit [Alphaproteobacteria bacterium]MDP6817330.1 xanthine dehydrogenase family protein molybdopterin-binding subunit [Alphaproteobacteria bacterium]